MVASQAFRACWKKFVEVKSVASRALWKLEKGRSVASRACWTLLEKVQGVASRACWQLLEKVLRVAAARVFGKLFGKFPKRSVKSSVVKLLDKTP
jgi:hypothetical protein